MTTDIERGTKARLLGLEVAIAKSNQEFGAAREFLAIARQYALAGTDRAGLIQGIGALNSVPTFAKAAATSTGDSELWGSLPGRDLSEAWLASIEEASLLDLISRYAISFPKSGQRGFIATGATADATLEGHAKVVRRLTLSEIPPATVKCVALIVATVELLAKRGALDLIQRELKRALLGKLNSAVIGAFPDTVSIASSGDAVQDLAAGIGASVPSAGYICFCTQTPLSQLIASGNGAGRIGAGGGLWGPGVHIVGSTADETSAGGSMSIVSASSVGLWVGDLIISSSGAATAELIDAPVGNSVAPTASQVISFFQTNSTGLLVERSFSISANAPVVVIE